MSVDWFFTTQGRITRIVLGSLLIIIGLGVIGGFFGVILLLVGAVPIASAAYGTFLLAPFFGRGIRGEREGGAPVEEPEDRADSEAGSDDEPDRSDDAGDAEPEERSAASSDDGEATGARPVRAERPPGQAPRTKDLRAEGSGSSESDES